MSNNSPSSNECDQHCRGMKSTGSSQVNPLSVERMRKAGEKFASWPYCTYSNRLSSVCLNRYGNHRHPYRPRSIVTGREGVNRISRMLDESTDKKGSLLILSIYLFQYVNGQNEK